MEDAINQRNSMKRNDIQGLRGWAITTVVLFHFFPSYFPNGYIGVDAFFVISGFLMAMILRKNEHPSASTIGIFYYKRIKRILPLYYLTISLILAIIIFFLPLQYQEINMLSSRRAILLISNLVSESDEQHYQKMLLGAEDLFTHMWSLCLEIQWYLIAPIIFLVQLSAIPWKGLFFPGICGCSIVFYYWTDKTTAFYSVFARIWQFSCGMVAFLEQQKMVTTTEFRKETCIEGVEEKDILLPGQISSTVPGSMSKNKIGEERLRIVSSVLFMVAATLSMIWLPLSEDILRVFITTLIAIIIHLGSLQQGPILSNGVIVYIGNISYTLYLFHWPIYVILKPYSLEQHSVLFLGIIVSVFLAMVTYHCYELHYLKWSPLAISVLLTFLIGISSILCFYLYKKDVGQKFDDGPVNYTNINPNDAAWNKTLMEYLNTKESSSALCMKTPFCVRTNRFDEKDVPHDTLCETKNCPGNYSILVIGNSYAFNQADIIYNSFRDQSSELNFFSFSGCEFLTATDPRICAHQNYNYSFILHALKPEILFVITRPLDGRARFDPLKSIDEDKIFNDYMNRIKEVEEVAKKVYLLQALPSCVEGCSLAALAFTSNKRYLREIKDGLIKKDEFFARERILEVGRRCKKCEIIDYLPYLVDEDGHYLGYNPKTNLMYYDTLNHFNRFGKERIQLLYNKLAKELKSKKL